MNLAKNQQQKLMSPTVKKPLKLLFSGSSMGNGSSSGVFQQNLSPSFKDEMTESGRVPVVVQPTANTKPMIRKDLIKSGASFMSSNGALSTAQTPSMINNHS